ncbi:DNA polymerase-3 subunit epsilon [Colwellia chukchiensis]|uniref:DNA-directed DNA polymerase n=1 Tax=Colwellia chukchiensis TaxID=641665 RepID=A0A1H7SP89_9GAMM|nr:3'-5' exonuclease [Colwellia chukchiensis]SEL73297.1 DNA polymerase-3 subunit epsilon [Colwellia chukchiensis]
MLANSLIVLDFETTGLSPVQGDRAIEIGAVKLENGIVCDRFQALMNPGQPISPFIESYTGISNQMLAKAPSCQQVMTDFAAFIDGSNLLAHNASFDARFLNSEFDRIGETVRGEFACSLLLARRIYQQAPNHQLGTLIDYKNIAANGRFHRALFDAEMTAQLWLIMLQELNTGYGIENISFSFIKRLAKTPKAKVNALLASYTSKDVNY